jgi:hypothetical protein
MSAPGEVKLTEWTSAAWQVGEVDREQCTFPLRARSCHDHAFNVAIWVIRFVELLLGKTCHVNNTLWVVVNGCGIAKELDECK